jgi:hypothetical protein
VALFCVFRAKKGGELMRRITTTFVNNLDIVNAKGFIPYWEISSKLNIHENTLRNWMKNEMDPEKKTKVLHAIEQIKHEEMLLAK